MGGSGKIFHEDGFKNTVIEDYFFTQGCCTNRITMIELCDSIQLKKTWIQCCAVGLLLFTD